MPMVMVVLPTPLWVPAITSTLQDTFLTLHYIPDFLDEQVVLLSLLNCHPYKFIAQTPE
jgi:hypothetical protein